MRRCVDLARRGEGRTAPNPVVGAVVVGRNGRVIAEGFHRGPGTPHGEAEALAIAGDRARGGTLYVSLEPCAHPSPRKPAPCADLVAASGVSRVVIGLRDPFPGHGGGVERIRAAGIPVDGPVEEDLCRRANEPWLTFATRQRAWFCLKAAMTLDGRIATATGESRWITGEAARRDVHERRNRCDAILVGAGTVSADDPLLTVRGVDDGRDPVRLILDGSLSMSPRARMLGGSAAPTIVVTTRDAPARRAAALEQAGAEVWRVAGQDGRVALRPFAKALAKRGILSVLVEGGAQTHAALLAAGLCDRLVLYVAPMAIGGPGAPPWLGGDGVASLGRAPRFRYDVPPRLVGDDLLLEAVPVL